MNPVPPVTKALMARHRIPRLEAVSAVENGSTRRAAQRAMTIGVGPGETDLSELRELLRTAGVAVAGEVVERRGPPGPDPHFWGGEPAPAEKGPEGARAQPTPRA